MILQSTTQPNCRTMIMYTDQRSTTNCTNAFHHHIERPYTADRSSILRFTVNMETSPTSRMCFLPVATVAYPSQHTTQGNCRPMIMYTDQRSTTKCTHAFHHHIERPCTANRSSTSISTFLWALGLQ